MAPYESVESSNRGQGDRKLKARESRKSEASDEKLRRSLYSSDSSSAERESGKGSQRDSGSKRRADERVNPRSRKPHKESSGSEGNADPDTVYRALRGNERPRTDGLRPPEGYDPDKTAPQHVAAGSRAKTKSEWVSTTRSRKVAAAWASETTPQGGRVSEVRISEDARTRTHDFTQPSTQQEFFPRGGMALNSAKSSQEVITRGGFEPADIIKQYRAMNLGDNDYTRMKAQEAAGETPTIHDRGKEREVRHMMRTRGKASETPKGRALYSDTSSSGRDSSGRDSSPEAKYGSSPDARY